MNDRALRLALSQRNDLRLAILLHRKSFCGWRRLVVRRADRELWRHI